MPSMPVLPLRAFTRLITASCLLGLVGVAGADAEQSDPDSRACLAEVRREMGRFKVKALDPKMQQEVAGLCARGDVEGALRFAVPAAAAQRCAERVRQAAEAEPALDSKVLGRAYQLCRSGETEAALALVGATTPDPPAEPVETPQPPPASTPPNIFRFQAEPTTVRSGEPSRLLWDVYSSREVSLDGESVPARGEKVVRPTRTTRYILEAISGTQLVEDKLTVAVSPYPPASLGASIRDIELCRELGNDGGEHRCVSFDGPFYRGDPVQVIIRFEDIAPGSHDLEYELFAGTGNPTRWSRIDYAKGPFQHPGRQRKGAAVRDHRRPSRGSQTSNTEASTAFALADQGKGPRKLVITLDGRQATRSEILYCVECPGHDEW
ncbi:MAG: hypothetical protein GY719_10675 [bacterium]|nr:hypothetical protein [bacterium]